MRKYFGTDGVRGIANSELTSSLAYRLGRYGAYVLSKHSDENKRLKAVIGTDTRVSKDMLKSALAAGIMSVGVDVIDLGIIPTPAVAYLTRELKADLGIVISASHNPMEYNGIKFFDATGFKLPDEVELEIEEYIDNGDEDLPIKTHENVGLLVECSNAKERYVDYLVEEIKDNFIGMNITLDCANGAAYEVAPMAFRRLGATVNILSAYPNGTNINYNCGSTHLSNLQKAVVENESIIGLAFDGDADRMLAVDENGVAVDGDKIMLIMAKFLKEREKLKDNKLVVTVMSNIGLHIAAKEQGIELEVTSVGDRYVLEKMLEKNLSIGGEQSGHTILLDYNTTGDGLLAALLLTSVLKSEFKSMSELAEIMDIYPQILINAKVQPKYKNEYMNNPKISEMIDSIEEEMHGQGRVLIRPSGTEPLVRVMLEGKEQEKIKVLAEKLAKLIEEELG
ncbi:MAG: phosphoglucosamine mutase [Filifactoraceae bacterium]